ncbi:PKD domain-containing protein [Lentiprolixibacter aurantiacus]|uniref:PKD domain-containing protein n=1 Tax=Lentiprolixibacter aurantiacus TaxID=2993939 RepID=A0AAE3MIR3_9FLAO|nr:PKD domain-containing protein [Lentiprolixibacter aurantiacus]MCX2717983.1 PKD domain-containing protein [Lentiprolixibacter aurantiacus]
MKKNYLLIFSVFLLITCSKNGVEENTPLPEDAVLEACFEMSQETILIGETLQITSCSKGASKFLYDFGNGDASTKENPVITYQEAGTYAISLTVSNESGKSSSFEEEVRVVSNDGFYFYPDIAEGFSSTPLELSINPISGKPYYIELLQDEVGSEGSKFYYRELSEDLSSERQYLADKPYNSNSAFVNFFPSGKQNFVFSRTLNSLYGTQEVSYDMNWAFLNGIQSAKKHSYGVLEAEGNYLYYGTEKPGDFHQAAIEIRNSNGDAFQVISLPVPGYDNATIGDMIAIEGGYVAFGGVFKTNMAPPYIADYYPVLLFLDASFILTHHVVFDETALTGVVDASDDLNGSFHIAQLSNGNLAMYAMGELWLTDANGTTLFSQHFEGTPNNQALVGLGDSFVISARDYLKKYNAAGSLLTELKYGGQYLPEIIRYGDSLFFVAGYEDNARIKTFYGSTDTDLNLISLQN